MGTPKDPTINAKVDADLKAKCEAFVEEDPNTSSLSHLVRRSLIQTIHEEDDDHGRPAGQGAAGGEQMAEVRDELRQLHSRLDELSTTIETIEVRTREPDQEITRLANRIFEVLPTREELTNYQQAISEVGRGLGDAHVGPPATDSGKLATLSRHLDEPPYRIQEAINELQQNTHRVQVTEIDGDERYYKDA